jgi:hypothetical protein
MKLTPALIIMSVVVARELKILAKAIHVSSVENQL